MLRTFAENLRRLFLVVGGIHFLQPCAAVSLGGMEGQASADAAMQPSDPWQFEDPWKPKKKSLKQSKWEDLQLQSDHPLQVWNALLTTYLPGPHYYILLQHTTTNPHELEKAICLRRGP